jgi:ribonuclease HI
VTPTELAAILDEAAELFAGKPATGSLPSKTLSRPVGRSLVIYVDGASRNNPGHSAAGLVIADSTGRILLEEGVYLGIGTNNAAEYRALLLALEKARELGADGLVIHSDSELVVRQMQGRYRVKEPALQVLHAAANRLAGEFREVRYVHVPRERNRHADLLANGALDEYTTGG